jgi:hypothetical protein
MQLHGGMVDLDMDHSGNHQIVVNSENKNKKYCVCGKQYDQHFYVQCEDQCEWFHPECVGFDLTLVQKRQQDILFICPFCKEGTRAKCFRGEKKGLYEMIQSEIKPNFFIFLKITKKAGEGPN